MTDGSANQPNSVTPFAQPEWQLRSDPVTVPDRRGAADVAAYCAAVGLAAVAAVFSIKGMV